MKRLVSPSATSLNEDLCSLLALYKWLPRLQHVIIISAVALKEFLILLGEKLELVFVLMVSLQKNLAPAKFSVSADKKYILLAQNVQKLFRHSYLAQYTVFDIQSR